MSDLKVCAEDCYCDYRVFGGSLIRCSFKGVCEFQRPKVLSVPQETSEPHWVNGKLCKCQEKPSEPHWLANTLESFCKKIDELAEPEKPKEAKFSKAEFIRLVDECEATLDINGNLVINKDELKRRVSEL